MTKQGYEVYSRDEAGNRYFRQYFRYHYAAAYARGIQQKGDHGGHHDVEMYEVFFNEESLDGRFVRLRNDAWKNEYNREGKVIYEKV